VITVVVIAKSSFSQVQLSTCVARRSRKLLHKKENRTVLKGRDLHRPVVHLDMDAVVAQLRRGDGVAHCSSSHYVGRTVPADARETYADIRRAFRTRVVLPSVRVPRGWASRNNGVCALVGRIDEPYLGRNQGVLLGDGRL
jgi:hypothetical protein